MDPNVYGIKLFYTIIILIQKNLTLTEEKAIKRCWGFKIVGVSLRTTAHNSTSSMSII